MAVPSAMSEGAHITPCFTGCEHASRDSRVSSPCSPVAPGGGDASSGVKLGRSGSLIGRLVVASSASLLHGSGGLDDQESRHKVVAYGGV